MEEKLSNSVGDEMPIRITQATYRLGRHQSPWGRALQDKSGMGGPLQNVDSERRSSLSSQEGVTADDAFNQLAGREVVFR